MSDVAPNYEGYHNKEELAFEELASSHAAALADHVALVDGDDDVGRTTGSKNVKRARVPVETIFSRLGARFIRKAYRMTEFSFWKLLSLLKPYLPKENKRKRGATPNVRPLYEATRVVVHKSQSGGDEGLGSGASRLVSFGTG